MRVTINQTTSAKPMTPGQEFVFGLVFTIIGIGLLLFSISTITSYNEKDKTYVEVTSTVVDYDYNTDDLEAIIVEYTVDGQIYRKTSNTYSSLPESIGTEIQIKYNPNSPSDIIWVNDSTNIMMPLIGGVFTVAGIIIVVRSIKKMGDERNITVEESNGVFNGAGMTNSTPTIQTNMGQPGMQNYNQMPHQQSINQPMNANNASLNQNLGNTNYSNMPQNQVNNGQNNTNV